ncbi:hypothetical protein D3C77_313140 [compost metagenome]
MEGGDPNVPSFLPYEPGHALLHFPGGLISKSNRKDRPWRRFARSYQIRDAMRKHPRLAAARTRHNEQRALRGLHGPALLWIQPSYRFVYIYRLHRDTPFHQFKTHPFKMPLLLPQPGHSSSSYGLSGSKPLQLLRLCPLALALNRGDRGKCLIQITV